MATAPSLRSGGARVYSQSGDIDQLLEDVWVPDDQGRRRDEQRSDSFHQRQPDPPSTEKERVLMAQLADAQQQLRELSRMRWGGGDGGSQSSGRDGYGGDRLNRTGGATRVPGDYSYPRDSSWSDSRASTDSRSPATNSGRESPEPLYVNTEFVAATAAKAPIPPPRTSVPPPMTSYHQPTKQSLAASVAGTVASKPGAMAGPATMPGHSSHHQRSSEKASSSEHEESVEVKESISIFQVYPPMASGAATDQQPRLQAPSATSLQGGRSFNVPIHDGGADPSRVFRFPPQSQAPLAATQAWPGVGDGSRASSRNEHVKAAGSTSTHQSSSSSRRAEQYHSHGPNPAAPIPAPQAQSSYRGRENVASHEWGDSSVAHKSQHQQQQSYRSEATHVSNNSHSVTHQSKEASSSAQHQSEGVSDVYSETTSLQPIGLGIQTLRSHTALHKLRQTNSGYSIDTNRVRTLNLSTPHLDQAPTATTFRSDQQLASPLQHSEVGPLRESSRHVAAPNASVQLLPMAFMVAMPTTAVSLQQLNMFSGSSGLPLSAYPALTTTAAHAQPHLMLTQQSQHNQRSPSLRQQQHQLQQQRQQLQQQQRSMHSSRSIGRSQQIASGGSSAHGSSSSSARGSSTGGGFRVLRPRIVVDTASSSGGSSSTIQADFEADEKPYMELAEMRPVLVSGTSRDSSAAARRSQSSSGTARAELLRSTKTSSMRGDAGGLSNRGRLSSAEQEDAVFNNATYASATLQASVLEPRSSFMRASSSNHRHHHDNQQQQQQQQQQRHLQVGGFNEQFSRANFSSSGGGGGWAASPGSVTPTSRFSGHSSTGGFDFDPPSPGGMLKFVKDTSQLWYLPNISRDEAIAILRPLSPGRFIVRDSTSFQGAYGLAVKVADVPPGAAATAGDPAADELVRHFLIEQTSKGVRIRGCANEPVFASLPALIYQHTVMPLALPCKLALPDAADVPDATADMAAAAASAGGPVDPRLILEHGAACNVLYLGATDIESLTGSGGLARAVDALLRNRERLRSCVCQLKVAKDGISLTDTARRQFFRKHYPTACVLYCGMDPAERSFDSNETKARGLSRSKIFGFVARKNPGSQENTAVVMCEVEEHQPAEAVVKFVCKYLIGSR